MGIEDIIQKHGYNFELAEFLRKAYPALVECIGFESIIYETLMSVPITITDNMYDYFNNKYPNSVEESVKYCAGAYISGVNLKYERYAKRYYIDSEYRENIIKGPSLLYERVKSILIHEICHAIKSHFNEYVIKHDTLINYSGFTKRIYHLNNDGENVSRTLWSETGLGLEEGLNTLLEEQVMSKILGRTFKSKGIFETKNIAYSLFAYNIPNIKEAVMEAQIYHDNTRLDSILGETFYKLIDHGDHIYRPAFEICNINLPKVKRLNNIELLKRLEESEFKPIQKELKVIGDKYKGGIINVR